MTKEKEGSIFNVLDDTEEVIKRTTGMKIKLPKPGKRSLEISALTNSIVGVSLVAYGLLSTQKWTMILGAAGIASSIIVRSEAKRMK